MISDHLTQYFYAKLCNCAATIRNLAKTLQWIHIHNSWPFHVSFHTSTSLSTTAIR